jgi:hypothetical protein
MTQIYEEIDRVFRPGIFSDEEYALRAIAEEVSFTDIDIPPRQKAF